VAGEADDDRVVGAASIEGRKLGLDAGAGGFLVDEKDGRAAKRVRKDRFQRRRIATGAAEFVDIRRLVTVDTNE